MTYFKKLFESTRIGKLAIKNRIAMAPMGIVGLCNPDGTYSQRVIDYYFERAKGGVGLIVTGGTKVENEIERVEMTTRPIMTQNPAHFIQMASELTEAVHTYGTKIFMQLTAGVGRVSKSTMFNTKPIAPSPIPSYWNPTVTCRELTTNEIEKLVNAIGNAAEIAALAEFDGVEVHSMHEGYLLDQFAVSMWNKRTDEYGGDLRGRLAFPIEILHAIKDKVGKEFPVQLRFSVKSYVKDWGKGALPSEIFRETARDVNDGLETAKILEKEGCDSFDADVGSYEAWYWAHPPTYMAHGCYLEDVEKLKKAVNVPILVAGKMDLPELAEKAIEKSKADMIALGRALLTDPYWPIKVRQGRTEDIRPCIGCHDGCIERMFEGKSLCCAVNPAVGRERLYELKPVQTAKKVLVAGGGIAGMEASRVAAIRGHNVALYEKNDCLGGHLVEGSVPDFKKDMERLLTWYKVQLKKVGVNVILNTEVTPELVESEKPDVVIVATGSKPVQPRIKGIEKPKVTTCIDLLSGKNKAGRTIVVVGGGLVGCETALWVAQQGKKTTIIEMLPELMLSKPPVPHMNRIMVLDLLVANKVKAITKTSIQEITDQGVVVIDENSKHKEIRCATVALAIGLKSEDQLYNLLREKVAQIYAIGDCKEPGRIMDTVWCSYSVASTI